MEYIARNITDRIAVGDDCFRMEKLSDGRYRLIPAPDSVVETGTNIDRALLQPMGEALAELARISHEIVLTEEDPGEGASVSYPDGTVIFVYE